MRKPQAKIHSYKEAKRVRRKLSIRKKLSGTAEVPRISVKKGNKNLSVQIIDDLSGKTLFSVQTFGKGAVEAKSNKEGAKLVGTKVAEGLKSKNIETAKFDRSGYSYHGVLSTLADSIREGGIRI